jgi:hypothetical protein
MRPVQGKVHLRLRIIPYGAHHRFPKLSSMVMFLFRCPATGYRLQGWVDDNPENDIEAYQPVTCLACGRVHLVNPKTGKTPTEVAADSYSQDTAGADDPGSA